MGRIYVHVLRQSGYRTVKEREGERPYQGNENKTGEVGKIVLVFAAWGEQVRKLTSL